MTIRDDIIAAITARNVAEFNRLLEDQDAISEEFVDGEFEESQDAIRVLITTIGDAISANIPIPNNEVAMLLAIIGRSEEAV